MAPMTMPVRSVRVRAGIVELRSILTKTVPIPLDLNSYCAGVSRAYINDCVSNQLPGTNVTSVSGLRGSEAVLY
jgi:hypothetical protein